MKKFFVVLSAVAVSAVSAFAQGAQNAQKIAADAAAAIAAAPKVEAPVAKVNYWKTSFGFDVGFNQTALFNWAAGGYNTLSLAAGIDAKADYSKDLMTWKNRLQLNYGFLWSADKKNLLQKSADRIYLESGWAYKTSSNSKWSWSAGLDFRSQFSDTYDNYQNMKDGQEVPWFGDLKSGFLAPAYFNVALGLDWKPAPWFYMNLAPVTGGLTIVENPVLRKTYGMKLADGKTDVYNPVLFQFGAQVKAGVSISINDVFKFDSQVVAFYDYLYDYKLNSGAFPVRVNWDNKISWQLSKLFKVGLDTWLIYDPLIRDGENLRGVQFKEFLSINFTYSISNPKKK